MSSINWTVVLSSAVFSVLGIVLYAVGFFVLDLLTPYQLWKEINEKQNTALAILIGSMAIGLAIIVAAAIHG
jgi:putative membrane protein